MMFEYHFFLSYAWRDNQPLLEGQERGWVASLRRTLTIRLEELLGQEVRSWWDRSNLRGNDAFREEIAITLSNVAALLAVLSPSHLESDWCRMERETFLHAIRRNSSIPQASRIFKIVKTPVPLEKHPPELQDSLGYEFYHKDPDTGRVRELRQGSGDDAERAAYLKKVDDLADDIRCLLMRLAGDRAPGGPFASATPLMLYLAESTFDLRPVRDRLVRMLKQRGYGLLPDGPLPLHGPDLRTRVREDLKRCRLSIHLVGSMYGMIPEGETTSVAAIQNEIAADLSTEYGFSRLIWKPPGLGPTDERQGEFLACLRRDSEAQLGAELLETHVENLETIIQDKLHPSTEPALRVAAGEKSRDLEWIYLICNQRDGDAVEELVSCLYDHGFEVVLPLFEGDEGEIREDHKAHLLHCDGVLIFYGLANEMWLRNKLLELHKLPGWGRPIERRLRAKAIYLAAPESSGKKRLRTREALVINGLEVFSPALLRPFLLQLEARKAG
ncbi:MAG: toll/interleukin-1 receptor domain-containing protein [bacterium]|nr:toll/interleukin-1 receptor domain-containing protein [bacterium]